MKKFIVVLLIFSALFTMAPKKPKPPSGIKGYEIVQDIRPLLSRDIEYIQVFCPEGKLVLGGGVNGHTEPTSLEILATHPDLGGVSWFARVQNSGLSTIQVTTFAICAYVAQ